MMLAGMSLVAFAEERQPNVIVVMADDISARDFRSMDRVHATANEQGRDARSQTERYQDHDRTKHQEHHIGIQGENGVLDFRKIEVSDLIP